MKKCSREKYLKNTDICEKVLYDLTYNPIVGFKNKKTVYCSNVRFSNEQYIIFLGTNYIFRIHKVKLTKEQKALFE